MTDDDRGMQMLGNAIVYCTGWVLLAAIWIVRRILGA